MVVTNTGKQTIAGWLAGEDPDEPSHIAVGDGTTNETANDTALESELDRIAVSTERNGSEVVFSASISSIELVGEDISEVGLLNADTDGDLFQRQAFSSISKTESFDVQIDITMRIK